MESRLCSCLVCPPNFVSVASKGVKCFFEAATPGLLFRLRGEQGAKEGGGVGRILKEADGGDAGSASGEASGRVIKSDAANGQDLDGNRCANFPEPRKALRRPERGFRGSGEDGAEENVAGAGGGSGLGGFERMTGDTHQKIRRGARVCAQEAPRFGAREGLFAEVNAAGGLRKGDVQAIVHDEARGFAGGRRRTNAAKSVAREAGAGPGGQIFFAQLNPRNSRGRERRNGVQELFPASRLGERRPSEAVRYVAKERLSFRGRLVFRRGVIEEGHAKDPGGSQ